MNARDFEYDGKNLSDIGFIICDFDHSGGLDTISIGSQITFNTSPVFRGARNELLSVTYNEVLESTFQICKDPCIYEDDMEITDIELRHIMKWLNRKEFHKFKILEVGYADLYFEGSFNISKIEVDKKIYGLELTLTTNRPWALREHSSVIIKNEEENGKHSITDTSDEEGYIYPRMEITVHQSGDLKIHNLLEDRLMVIKNCTEGEIINLEYPTIQTSIPSHKINNDFNWSFFRIANTFKTGKNDITISIPCTIKIFYSPIVKLGL